MILRLNNIHQSKSGNDILNGVSLLVPEGSFFVLMGPTGCGKTSLLRIAGLLDAPRSGEMFFKGTKIPQKGKNLLKTRRKIATMFQSPVMFRGTVASNVGWGLKIRGVKQPEISKRIDEILEFVGLEGFRDRDASTLSGGEKRRAALARALVIEPELLILDEPTTSLDPTFKRDLLRKIKEIHKETGITFLMATHDFTDALAVGTTGAVMRSGLIEQSGCMDDILFKPQNQFMASFTGVRNIFPAEFRGNEAAIRQLTVTHSALKEGHGFLAIPPEVIVLSLFPNLTSERNRFDGVVKSIERNGTNWDITVEVSGIPIIAAITTGALEELAISAGSAIHLSFKASAVHIF